MRCLMVPLAIMEIWYLQVTNKSTLLIFVFSAISQPCINFCGNILSRVI
jgi:hypothetical protein